MCGIVGFYGHGLDRATLQAAVEVLHHRGPDGEGLFLDAENRVGLGHARLSVIDLEHGQQPLYSEDREIVLVCNGEIYDFERIRADLRRQGHYFATASDSELIIHLYQQYGLSFVDQLRGEFAFLLYDRAQQILLAVRDRFGIKPLFFNQQGDKYLFASEAKGIFATGLLAPTIDVVAVRDYLSAVVPDAIFEGIQAIPPGSLLRLDLATGTHELRRYWDLDLCNDDQVPARHLDEHLQTVRALVEEAVRLRMRADVPVGVYLSGGIDSSVIAATAAKFSSSPLPVFTIAFPQSDHYNEFTFARDMADKLGAELFTVACDNPTLIQHSRDCLWACELPFPNFHTVGKFLLSRLAHQQVKVVLTGEGADETFLGYPYFQTQDPANWAHLPGRGLLRKYLMRLSSKSGTARAIHQALGSVSLPMLPLTLSPLGQAIIHLLFSKSQRRRLTAQSPLQRLQLRAQPAQTQGCSIPRQLQFFSIKQILAPYLLTNLGDRVEMAHAVEARTPFLDHVLFEGVRAIPDSVKTKEGKEKFLLREAFRDDLTEKLYARKKWPYLAPPIWISEGQSVELDQLIRQHLSQTGIERSGIFAYRTIRAIRWFHQRLNRTWRLKAFLNTLLTFCLTVQMVEDLFTRTFTKACARAE